MTSLDDVWSSGKRNLYWCQPDGSGAGLDGGDGKTWSMMSMNSRVQLRILEMVEEQ